MIKQAAIYIGLLGLVGCTTASITGEASSPVPVENVKVMFKGEPKCKYEELGFIATPLMWNQNVAIQSAREKAASIGADYLVIESVVKNVYNGAVVSGMAYKCSKEAQEKTEAISSPQANNQ